QHRIETDTHKRAFARDAVFLGGLGCGSRHLRIGRKVQSLYSTRQTSKQAGRLPKKPFKSAAYLNEKHSRFDWPRTCDAMPRRQTKNRALDRYAVSIGCGSAPKARRRNAFI